MIKRALKKICFGGAGLRQMRFITGPRQVGKTTLAKSFLHEVGCSDLYYNWDLRGTKDRFRGDPYFYNSDALKKKTKRKGWICFDEVHKYPKWKNVLKDAFDSFEDKYNFIITGSARLDLLRKSGDSLSGRYFLYRLLPVSLFEMVNGGLTLPTNSADKYIENSIHTKCNQSDMEQLIRFGGFPEPLLKSDEVFSSNWHEEYIDTLVKEDLRDLTKIQELENVITLMRLLPSRIGSPLSINSLKEDLEISYNAVKNYLRALSLTYVLFKLPPYSKKLSRAIKKETKVYFFDWTKAGDEAARFENYVACELKNRVELWSMATKYKFDLAYIRMRDGRETDFLVTRDNNPYFLVEVKLSTETIASHNINHAKTLGNIPLVQLIFKPDVLKAGRDNTYLISASNFFS